VNLAVELGISVDYIKKQKCVRFIGAVESIKGYAFKVPCSSLPIGDTTVPVSAIYVPFEFLDDKTKYRFVSKGRFLVGTDILNNYNMSVTFNNELSGLAVISVYLEMTPHHFKLPQSPSQLYTLGQLAKIVDELKKNSEEGLTEIVSEED
jgi:hypothetical protein